MSTTELRAGAGRPQSPGETPGCEKVFFPLPISPFDIVGFEWKPQGIVRLERLRRCICQCHTGGLDARLAQMLADPAATSQSLRYCILFTDTHVDGFGDSIEAPMVLLVLVLGTIQYGRSADVA